MADVPAALRRMAEALHATRRDGLHVWVRPRTPEMVAELDARYADLVAGWVLPKFDMDSCSAWLDATSCGLRPLMPTLETRTVFEQAAMVALRDRLLAAGLNGRIRALRIGGNDLLSLLGLRRAPGRTAYELPLGSLMASLIGIFVPAGFHLTAPVFDILDDEPSLQREVDQDVSWGLIGKTAVHPAQVRVIDDAFRVRDADVRQARAILDSAAAAVFRKEGAMCEPATHRCWAERVMARAGQFGIR